jgi:hypothetical protein
MSLIIDGTNGVTFNDSSLQGAAASPYVLKNRIINGAMTFDQRNAGATTSTTNGYTLDRFYFYSDISGVSTTVQQVSDAPSGFTNSLKVTASTGATAGTGKQSVIGQSIEGYNIADLAWGTASAKTITISFWVKSSLTGTFAGNLQNAAPNRDYVFTYSISAANTWEQKTITITGDTSGTWGTTNGVGLIVYFNMGSNQSSFGGTANTWSASIFRTVTGSVELLQTTGATWQVTGVQLEVGSTATPFERRLYGQELINCQRYYYKNKADSTNSVFGSAFNDSTTVTFVISNFPVSMRVAPSGVQQTGTTSDYRIRTAGSVNTICSAVPAFTGSTTESAWTEFTVASGLTAGQGCVGRANTTAAFLAWSAEL